MNDLDKLLSELADEIDLTESQEGVIKHAYNGVADWLNAPDSPLAKYKVHIFPQGSMMYGTTIKPINEEDDYDVDLVCKLTEGTENISAKELKQSVGRRLATHKTYKAKLDKEGRRCWTLQSEGQLHFHMDILPAIPYNKSHLSNAGLKTAYESMTEWKKLALLATDNKTIPRYDFIATNPRGYAEWFKQRMRIGTQTVQTESVERLPQQKSKTVLQKAIQLLKRHRDVMFADDENEVKPISIIITTLVAKCYNGGTSLYGFICDALANLESNIRHAEGKYSVTNPVMTSENFADKWQEDRKKAEAFFKWRDQAIKDFQGLALIDSYTALDREFKRIFAQKPVDRLMRKYQEELSNEKKLLSLINQNNVSRALTTYETIPYRKKAPWALPKGYRVSILAEVSYDNKRTYQQFFSGNVLPKGAHLLFTPMHGVKSPYKVKWQITNTGEEAKSEGCLRGQLFEDGNIPMNGILAKKEETTSFAGAHYIQCFIIQHGNQCVAMSKPFVVIIE